MVGKNIETFQNLDQESKERLKFIAFGVANGLYYLYLTHKTLQKQIIDRSFNDPALWNNDYPIVLVHGYCGSTMDENWILGGYFHYGFSDVARKLNHIDEDNDANGPCLSSERPSHIEQIYEADVSPMGSAHDRACELYQMLIGKNKIEQICRERGLELCEAVYGKEYVNRVHGGNYYKIRYLKSYDCSTGKMLAYPEGLPGWNALDTAGKINKVHFIGHSMGVVTIRYLQYLLQIGYFDEIHGHEPRDKSHLVASVTSLSGANNGSILVNHCGMLYDRKEGRWVMKNGVGGKMMWAFKQTIFWQNFFFSQNRPLERVKQTQKLKGEVVELGYQYSNLFYDMNAEAWGWNREANEGRWAYYKRLRDSHFDKNEAAVAFMDLNPSGMMNINEKIQTNPATYYFSITHGFKDEVECKAREVFKVPQKVTNFSLGFKLQFEDSYSLQTSRKRNEEQGWLRSLKTGVLRFIKYLSNPFFTHFSLFFETQAHIDALQPHLSSILNPNMNNIEEIDYAISDWLDDNDFCLSRKAQEFPRLTPGFTNHFSNNKPWGQGSDPVSLQTKFSDPSILKPGIWYYGGIPMTDHLDLAGFPQHLSPIRNLLGLEFRHEQWRIIYLRLKMLKY